MVNIQSQLVTMMRARFSKMESRIIMAIVDQMQEEISKHRAGNSVPEDYTKQCNFTLQAKELLNGSKHYEEIKEAVEALQKKSVQYYDDKSNTWLSSSLAASAVYLVGKGRLTLTIPDWLATLLVDFRHGFNRYNFRSAMSIQNPTAIRMYQLFCDLRHAVIYTVTFLRGMLGVTEDKYKQNSDFIKRFIRDSKNYLDEHQLNSYTYTLNRDGRNIKSITFRPLKHEDEEPERVMSKMSVATWIRKDLRLYLVNQCHMTDKDIARNQRLIADFSHLADWQERIVAIEERKRRARASNGYIIQAMRGAIKEGTN